MNKVPALIGFLLIVAGVVAVMTLPRYRTPIAIIALVVLIVSLAIVFFLIRSAR
jgi:hypothetical protein